jgi:hypothetical protein
MSEDLIAGERDALAGEYVLGTLDANERAAAQGLLAANSEFAAKVRLWERRLGELHLMVEPVEPEGQSDIWQRIKAKLPEVQPQPTPEPSQLPMEAAEPGAEAATGLEPEPSEQLKPDPGFVLVPEPSPETVKSAEPAASEPEWVSLDSGLLAAVSEAVAPETAAAEPAAAAAGESTAAREQPAEITVPEPDQLTEAAAAGSEEAAGPSTSFRPGTMPSDAAMPPFPLEHTTPSAGAGEHDERLRTMQRHLVGWRAVAVLMTVAVLAVVSLLALWRYEPERVPPALRPHKLMRLVGITLDMPLMHREPAPPESRFDE